MKLIPAPIDNKNLMEDSFEDEVFQDLFEAHDHRDGKGTRHLIGKKDVFEDGFVNATGIVDVRWSFGDNGIRITLLAVSGCANTDDWEYARKAIFNEYRKTFKSWECPSNEDLVVDFYELVNTLTVIFKFKCEDQ